MQAIIVLSPDYIAQMRQVCFNEWQQIQDDFSDQIKWLDGACFFIRNEELDVRFREIEQMLAAIAINESAGNDYVLLHLTQIVVHLDKGHACKQICYYFWNRLCDKERQDLLVFDCRSDENFGLKVRLKFSSFPSAKKFYQNHKDWLDSLLATGDQTSDTGSRIRGKQLTLHTNQRVYCLHDIVCILYRLLDSIKDQLMHEIEVELGVSTQILADTGTSRS